MVFGEFVMALVGNLRLIGAQEIFRKHPEKACRKHPEKLVENIKKIL
jgi:hypothetical protein